MTYFQKPFLMTTASLRSAGYASLAVLLSCFVLFCASCSGIAEDERLIFVKPAQSARAVLIEDFTGQRCINCPNAALEIEKLKEQYGADTIIAVGIHSGPLAVFSRGAVLGLRTEEGDAYYEHWGIQQEPMGYINRRGNISTVDQWPTLVREAVQQPSDVALSLLSFLDEETRQLEITLQVINGTDIDGHVQVWITEDDITALQMMPDGTANPDYVHQHVFRKSVNGLWGDVYQAAAGDIDDLSFFCSLDEDWNIENLNVVAFIYTNEGVQQVTECSIDVLVDSF
ncbi:MAG: Omp28 family outer membrane lipoprotein [Bacteroidaceae bacterium]|nr:Omp28 family outer membrane lipoprotein [Bacteroidaceae bacterium]